MTLDPTWPAPLTAARFRCSVEGWTVAALSEIALALAPEWVAISDPTANALDLTGACRVVASASDAVWFFAAPNSVVDRAKAALGGSISFARAVPSLPADLSTTVRPDLVLQSDTASFGLRMAPSVANGFEICRAQIAAHAGWINLSDGRVATAEQLQSLIAELTGILIRGGPSDGRTPSDLMGVDIYPDPKRLIVPTLEAWFEAAVLNVRLVPSPLATAYVIELRDAANRQVLSVTVPADAIHYGVVAVADAQFTPLDGASYAVAARAVGGTSSAISTVFTALAAPVLSVSLGARGAHVSWPEIQNATSFDLQVAPKEGGSPVLDRTGLPAAPVDLGLADGLAAATDYVVRVRARAGAARGPWSDAADLRLPSSREILQGLLDRMTAARTGSSIPLDASVLPPDTIGAPGEVLAALLSSFAGEAVAISVTSGPELADDALRMAGTAALLGSASIDALAVFRVEGGQLCLRLTLVPAAGWRLSDGFPLDATAWDELLLTDTKILFSTNDEPDGASEGVKAGLTLAATLHLSRQLARLRFGDTVPDDAVQSRIRGEIRQTGGDVFFDLTALDPLEDLNLAAAGLPVQTVSHGQLTLSRRADDHGRPIDTLVIDGTAEALGIHFSCRLDVPTIYTGQLLLALTGPADASFTFDTVLSLAGSLSGGLADLREWFGTRELSSVRTIEYRFPPEGGTVDLRLVVGLATAWAFNSTLSIEAAQIAIRMVQDPGSTVLFHDFRVLGHVRADGQDIGIEARIPGSGDWALTFAATPPITLASLASLAGCDITASLAELPSVLQPVATVGLEAIELHGQPSQSLSLVLFSFVQGDPWSIGNVVTIKDASLRIAVGVAAGRATGYMSTTVVLGSGSKAVEFRATGPVPPAHGEAWSVEMEPEQTIALPSLSDLTQLFGGSAPATPPGTDQLSSLVIDGLLVRFDPEAEPVLRQILLSIRQGSDWILIGPDQLALSGVYGHFNYDKAGSELTLDAGGSLTILGTKVDARLLRPSATSDWSLTAQTGAEIPATGVAALDPWMNPGAIGGYLGSASALAGPIRMGGVALDFASDDGALKRMAFAVSFDLGWTLIRDKLTIDHMSAVLATTVPVSASSWTGTLIGDLTVFGAPIHLTATKATADSSWAFRGELAKIVPIDLAASAASLAEGATFVLPADIGSFGAFPSQITIDTARVDAVPDTGHFRFRGAASFTGWSVNLAAASLEIRQIGGEILLMKAGDPLRVRVTGSLAYAGAHIDVFLQLGDSPSVDTVVAGIVSPASVGALSLASAVDSVAGTGTWGGTPLPAGYLPPALTSAGFYLNLSKGVLALYGRAGIGADASLSVDAALLIRRVPESEQRQGAGPSYGCAFVLDVPGAFHFVDLVPGSAPDAIRTALGVLDAAISLRDVSIAISSFDQPEGDTKPLAALTGVRPDADLGANLPSSSARDAAQIARGLNIYGKVAFEGALWQALKFVVDLTDATFSFYGRLDPADPAQTLFLGEIADATVLTYLHFAKLQLKYQSRPAARRTEGGEGTAPLDAPPPAPAPYLAVGGSGSLALPGIADIAFTGWVVFDTHVTARGESARGASFDASVDIVENGLFGIPHVSLALTSIRMAWTLGDDRSAWKRDEFAIVATATLGRFTCHARVDLSDGTRQSIFLSIDTDHILSLQHLVVDGLGATWLDGAVPDLSFESGWLSWSRSQDGAATYALHAEARIIGCRFLFDASLTDGQGFTGTADLDAPIDFGFLKLSGPSQPAADRGDRTAAKGPRATVKSNASERSAALDSVVTLFGQDFVLHLAYAKPAGATEAAYSGSVATTIGFGSLGSVTPTIDLSYTESGGLDVKLVSLDIPWDEVRKIINFVDMVEKATSGLSSDPCKALGDLGLGPDAVQLSFNCSLAFPRLTPQSGSSPPSIDIDLVVAYEIRLDVLGYRQVLRQAEMQLGLLSLAIPAEGITFARVAESLVTALLGAAPRIVAELLGDPSALLTLAEMLAANRASEELFRNLVCRRIDTPSNDPEIELNKGVEAAAAGSVEAAATAYASAFAITVGILSFLDKIWDMLSGSDRERKRKAEEQQRRALLGIANLLRPTSAALAFTASDTVTMTCTPPDVVAEGNGATFVFQLFRVPSDGGPPQQVPPRAGEYGGVEWREGDASPTLTMSFDALVPGADYQASVAAVVIIDGLSSPGQRVRIGSAGTMAPLFGQASSDAVSSAKVRLPDVRLRSLTLEQVGAQVAATLVEGNEVATSILLQWVGEDGNVAGVDPAMPPFPGTAAGARRTVRLSPPASTGRFVLRATASVGAISYQLYSRPLQILDLAAPLLAAPQFVREAFAVRGRWDAVPNAGGYRLQLLETAENPELIGSIEATTELSADVEIGDHAGLSARLRVATLPTAGDGAVWSEPQGIDIPGAALVFDLADVPAGQSRDGVTFTIRQIVPASATVLTLAPGDTGKALGTGPIAAFSAERSTPLPAGAALIRRLSYTIDVLQPEIAISAPLDFNWPAPDGTTKTSDWALALPGASPLWHGSASPAAMAARLLDGVASLPDRVAIATGLEQAIPASGLVAAVLAQSSDAEGLAPMLAPIALAPAERIAILAPAFSAAGQDLDIVSVARLLAGGAGNATVDALDALASSSEESVETLAVALRGAGFTLAQTATQLIRARPSLKANQLARALVAAFVEIGAYTRYAQSLLARGLAPPIVAIRLARLAVAGAAFAPVDRLALLLTLLRAQGKSLRDAALQAKTALPKATAKAMASGLVKAYFEDPTPLQAAVVGLGAAWPQPSSPQAQQRLAWALQVAGVPVADISPLVDAVFGLAPDDGARATALAAMLAPVGAAELVAQLVGAPGSPFAAVRANAAAFAPFTAIARLALLGSVYPGLCAQPSLLAAGLASSGSAEGEVKAALVDMLAGIDDAEAAEAWTGGQSLITEIQ